MPEPIFQNDHERFCFQNAAYFTTVRGARPANRSRVEHTTFSAAAAAAANTGDGRTMIYAVTAAGRFAHICNG